MTKYTASWFDQADEDIASARILREQGGSPNAICFHAQQAAEKCLKGFLAHHEKHTRKIHDLPVLLAECAKIDPGLAELNEDAGYLNMFYIKSRYPDDFVRFSPEEADKALAAAERIKNLISGTVQSK